MKKKKKKPSDEIRVRGVSPSLVETLENIRMNLGITLTAYLKPKLRAIADNEPENLKRAPLKD